MDAGELAAEGIVLETRIEFTIVSDDVNLASRVGSIFYVGRPAHANPPKTALKFAFTTTPINSIQLKNA